MLELEEACEGRRRIEGQGEGQGEGQRQQALIASICC